MLLENFLSKAEQIKKLWHDFSKSSMEKKVIIQGFPVAKIT